MQRWALGELPKMSEGTHPTAVMNDQFHTYLSGLGQKTGLRFEHQLIDRPSGNVLTTGVARLTRPRAAPIEVSVYPDWEYHHVNLEFDNFAQMIRAEKAIGKLAEIPGVRPNRFVDQEYGKKTLIGQIRIAQRAYNLFRTRPRNDSLRRNVPPGEYRRAFLRINYHVEPQALETFLRRAKQLLG